MKEAKFSCGISAFGNTCDRFVQEGYKERKTIKELIDCAAQVPDLEAIELVEGWHVSTETLDEVYGWVKEENLKVSLIHPDLWTQRRANLPHGSQSI